MNTGILVLTGEIELMSPTLIGCGKNEFSDIDVLVDADDMPYLPATSLVGVLQHSLVSSEISTDFSRWFWGYSPKNSAEEGRQSALRCSDAVCVSPRKIVVRDGVKIDHVTGLAQAAGKYDYQVVERGARFRLNLEIDFTDTYAPQAKRMLRTLFDALSSGAIRIGAKTTSGLGAMQLLKPTCRLYNLSFTRKEHVAAWMTRNLSLAFPIQPEDLGQVFPIQVPQFTLNASFWLRNSLIIRSYSADPKMPDATHLTSNGTPVLPGTSLKGAIRARAERIVNTLAAEPGSLLTDLFGYVETDMPSPGKARKKPKQPKARKGKLLVQETELPEFVAELQNRIRIDRFTGGTIDAALFDSMPLFGGKPDKIMHLKMQMDRCEDYEIGLLLLVLKDLWTGDVAIGGEKNVGRGVLQGIEAILSWKDTQIRITEDFGELAEQNRNRLEGYVKALHNKLRA